MNLSVDRTQLIGPSTTQIVEANQSMDSLISSERVRPPSRALVFDIQGRLPSPSSPSSSVWEGKTSVTREGGRGCCNPSPCNMYTHANIWYDSTKKKGRKIGFLFGLLVGIVCILYFVFCFRYISFCVSGLVSMYYYLDSLIRKCSSVLWLTDCTFNDV